MLDSLNDVRDQVPADAPDDPPRTLRVISWNLLRLVGAGVPDVAALIKRHHPDILLMQEATEDLQGLPAVVGGHFFREPMHGRVYGLAIWSPHPLPKPRRLPLPVSSMPGHFPPRIAQIVRIGAISFANVHLSHGQFLNRWQLLHIARSLDGPAAAVVGDYNAVGPIKVPGLRDVGPRAPTHAAKNLIALRLDRCMVRGLRCRNARVLERGPSDHHPIILELDVVADTPRKGALPRARELAADRWHHTLEGGLGNFVRAVSEAPDRIRGQRKRAVSARKKRGALPRARPLASLLNPFS
ncbi:MAG: endonuclease/exonuclease/phosphatase family protein [Acetobacteraceae bacterium]